jgi:hypothetical protein
VQEPAAKVVGIADRVGVEFELRRQRRDGQLRERTEPHGRFDSALDDIRIARVGGRAGHQRALRADEIGLEWRLVLVEPIGVGEPGRVFAGVGDDRRQECLFVIHGGA